MQYNEILPDNILIEPGNPNSEFGERLMVVTDGDFTEIPNAQLTPNKAKITATYLRSRGATSEEHNPAQGFKNYSKLCGCTISGHITIQNTANKSRKVHGDFIKVRFQKGRVIRSAIIFISTNCEVYQVHEANKMTDDKLNLMWDEYKQLPLKPS
ncbi:MAG: hypothetical protein ACI9TY_000031 [Alphaproteobacteria bacterium]|jgi:hypothetical protein